jgi:isochorismate hydrolase
MYVGKVKDVLLSERPQDIILVGIESHVCVLQTALDLIQAGYTVHLLADGVSSCNKEEIPIALSRIKQAGGFVTTSESAAFQLMVDSDTPKFKPFSSAIKEAKESTENALKAMADVGHKSLL